MNEPCFCHAVCCTLKGGNCSWHHCSHVHLTVLQLPKAWHFATTSGFGPAVVQTTMLPMHANEHMHGLRAQLCNQTQQHSHITNACRCTCYLLQGHCLPVWAVCILVLQYLGPFGTSQTACQLWSLQAWCPSCCASERASGRPCDAAAAS